MAYRYDARYRKEGDPTWTYVEGIGAEPWTLADLEPATTYEAQFRAYDTTNDLASDWSDTVIETTGGPVPVEDVEATELSVLFEFGAELEAVTPQVQDLQANVVNVEFAFGAAQLEEVEAGVDSLAAQQLSVLFEFGAELEPVTATVHDVAANELAVAFVLGQGTLEPVEAAVTQIEANNLDILYTFGPGELEQIIADVLQIQANNLDILFAFGPAQVTEISAGIDNLDATALSVQFTLGAELEAVSATVSDVGGLPLPVAFTFGNVALDAPEAGVDSVQGAELQVEFSFGSELEEVTPTTYDIAAQPLDVTYNFGAPQLSELEAGVDNLDAQALSVQYTFGGELEAVTSTVYEVTTSLNVEFAFGGQLDVVEPTTYALEGVALDVVYTFGNPTLLSTFERIRGHGPGYASIEQAFANVTIQVIKDNLVVVFNPVWFATVDSQVAQAATVKNPSPVAIVENPSQGASIDA